jgi:hypothetical protein
MAWGLCLADCFCTTSHLTSSLDAEPAHPGSRGASRREDCIQKTYWARRPCASPAPRQLLAAHLLTYSTHHTEQKAEGDPSLTLGLLPLANMSMMMKVNIVTVYDERCSRIRLALIMDRHFLLNSCML